MPRGKHRRVISRHPSKKTKKPIGRANSGRVSAVRRARSIKRHLRSVARAKAGTVGRTKRAVIEAQPLNNLEEIRLIDEAIEDVAFTDYVSKSVGKRARSIIKILEDPQTDEEVAEKLELKINEVRRMLNTLNTYGVARYNVNKDSKGWLTFKWYIDTDKLVRMREEIAKGNGESVYKIPEWCNDFFICEKCYEEEKTIFPFDAAFEMDFRCDAGHPLQRVNRAEVEQLVMQEGKVL